MTPPPAPVIQGAAAALDDLGLPGEIRDCTPVSGGCINHGVRLTTQGGRSYFLKWNDTAPAGLFEAEAHGLRSLARACDLRVPEPLAHGGGPESTAWFLMEHIETGRPAPDYQLRLGEGLAQLHRFPAEGTPFGWPHDNWLGSLAQGNGRSSSWAEFWRDRRLAPQLRRAWDRGLLSGPATQSLDRVMILVDTALADVDQGPTHLLHGDLWSGNVFPGPQGEPVLIDPAVYHGHGEVDLAMTELFGGFDDTFYRAYGHEMDVPPAYEAYRRDLYQLYYLLAHVNLFGAQYEGRTLATARRVVAALRA